MTPADEASVNPPGAGDEAVDAVARALMKRWIDQANAERYEGGPHTSPMVEPEEYDIDDPPKGMEEQARLDAETAVEALDRVRSRPDSGTEPDPDNTPTRIEVVTRQRDRWVAACEDYKADAEVARRERDEARAASGTEPDTAKLVEALRTLAEPPKMSDPYPQLWQRINFARDALAAFSVDAGNTKENR